MTTPLKKAIGRAKDAHRLMQTRGTILSGFVFCDRCNTYTWVDTGTNLIIHLKGNGSYLGKEVTHEV